MYIYVCVYIYIHIYIYIYVTARVKLLPHDTAMRRATPRSCAYITPGAGTHAPGSAQTGTQTGARSHASAEHTNAYKATQSRCKTILCAHVRAAHHCS